MIWDSMECNLTWDQFHYFFFLLAVLGANFNVQFAQLSVKIRPKYFLSDAVCYKKERYECERRIVS